MNLKNNFEKILSNKEIEFIKKRYNWHEMCSYLGYWKKGKSYIIEDNESQNIFCISEQYMQKIMKSNKKTKKYNDNVSRTTNANIVFIKENKNEERA